MKKFAPVIAALLAACFLSACGGAPNSASPSSAASEAAYDYNETAADAAAPGKAVPTSENGFQTAGQALPANRKIIRHLSLRMETREFESALASLRQIVSGAGGYIEQENVMGRSVRQKKEEQPRSAYIMARIPSEKLDGAAAELSDLCNVTERQESTEDVTETYFDAQAHLKSLEVQEERLLAILEKSEKLEDVVSLEQALTKVRYEIESITASLRHMDSQVNYSYLEINLDEVVEYTEARQTPKSFGEELSLAATDSGQRVVSALKGLTLFLVSGGPVLLIFLIILWIILRCLRIYLRKRGVSLQDLMKDGSVEAPGNPTKPESPAEKDASQEKQE